MAKKKNFASMDRRGSTAAREAMAARYAGSVDPDSLPVAKIVHNPRNRRDPQEYADEKAHGMAKTMRYVGVLQPLGVVRRETWMHTYEAWVREHPKLAEQLGEAEWIVMWGNRRLAAARLAELDEVPVRVQDRVGERGHGHVSTLIENIHHRKLAPLSEAAEVQELVDDHGSKSEVADMLGKSNGWITQRLSLLNLLPELQSALQDRTLRLEHARALGAIPPERQQAAWEAGPPYRDPAKQKPKPASVPAPAEADGEHKPAAISTSGAAAPEAEFYAVKPEASNGERGTPSPALSAASMIPTDPGELAHVIKNQLGTDAVRELIRLLQ